MTNPIRCPHCHERIVPPATLAEHHDGPRWLCPKAANGDTLYEAQVADAVHAAVEMMRCPTCGGTRVPRSTAGAPRGTCHCPENLEPVPGSAGERRLRARRGLPPRGPCMLPPKPTEGLMKANANMQPYPGEFDGEDFEPGHAYAPKPKVKLVGEDGNAFAILGRARQAAKAAGWSPEQITAYTNDATSGDYNHLLAVTMEWFDVR